MKKNDPNDSLYVILEQDYKGWKKGHLLDVLRWKADQLISEKIARTVEGSEVALIEERLRDERKLLDKNAEE
jgi:hypothetical protein